MKLSFQKFFYVQASILGFFIIMYLGRPILIPLAFAFLVGFILYPLVNWLEKKGVNRTLGIIITMVSVTLLILGIGGLFSAQIVSMVEQYDNFFSKMNQLFTSSLNFLNEKVRVIPDIQTKAVMDRAKQFFSDSGLFIVSDTLNFTSTFLSWLVLTFVYTFLVLLYRTEIVKGLTLFADENNRSEYRKMLREVQRVGQQYLTGMFTLMLILGFLNSVGLLLLGIDYAFFFGFLAALMAVVPYVGTTLGGLIPTLYALVTYDSYWYPVGVILIFWFVQFLEGNFLNPKIVGGNLNLNALAAILSLIVGGIVWGIPGMIIFLPFTAMFKVVCEHYDELKPVGRLLSDAQAQKKSGDFKQLIGKVTKTLKN